MLSLKNTAPGGRPEGGNDKAREALLSNLSIPQIANSYNLLDLLPTQSDAWNVADINRVKNAVIAYCRAMDAGDTATMLTASVMLQAVAGERP